MHACVKLLVRNVCFQRVVIADVFELGPETGVGTQGAPALKRAGSVLASSLSLVEVFPLI